MERYRLSPESSVYYVTFSVIQWLPIFVREEPCKIVTESLNYCINSKGLIVSAYCLMPTHLHAVIAERSGDSRHLAQVVDDFRKFTGRHLADWCDNSGPAAFRAALREEAKDDRTRRLWQASRHPETIYSSKFLMTKVTYLHNNPVRAGLVRAPEDWRFSSAVHYASGGAEQCHVKITDLEW